MNKIAITGIHTDLLDVSTVTERDYVQGDTKIILAKWSTNPSLCYFEKSEASIMLSKLPSDLRMSFNILEKGIIDYIASVNAE